MKNIKIILLLLGAYFCSIQTSTAQAILGGAGVCLVDADPDLITDIQTQNNTYGCHVAWDATAAKLYVYESTQALGNRWTEVPLSAVVDSDERLTNPRVVGTDLVFDILDQISNTVSGTETISILDFAPSLAQDLTLTFPSATEAEITLSDVNGNGGGTATIVEGTGINIEDDGSGNLRINSTGSSDADWFVESTTNTPTGITDNIWTDGRVSIGSNTFEPNYRFQIHNGSVLMKHTALNPVFRMENSTNAWRFGNSGVDFKIFPIPTESKFIIEKASNSGIGVLTVDTDTEDLTFHNYPNTRDDSATTTPINVLYTNPTGEVLSTSVSAIADPIATIAAKNHADAGSQGVGLNEYFYASTTNTMGMVPGTKIKRLF